MHKLSCEEDRRLGTDPELSAEVGRAADAWCMRWKVTLATMANIALELDADPSNARRHGIHVHLTHMPDVAPPDCFAVDIARSGLQPFRTMARDGSTRDGYWRQFHELPQVEGGINCWIVCSFWYGVGSRESDED